MGGVGFGIVRGCVIEIVSGLVVISFFEIPTCFLVPLPTFSILSPLVFFYSPLLLFSLPVLLLFTFPLLSCSPLRNHYRTSKNKKLCASYKSVRVRVPAVAVVFELAEFSPPPHVSCVAL